MNLSPNFSKTPGAWEQQLQRRWNNPLFPESSRTVVQHQVVEARERDNSDQEQFRKNFQQLVEKISELPERAETQQLLELIPELEQRYTECMTLGVDLPQERQALSRLTTLFEQTLLRHAGEDNSFLQQLQQEQAARKMHHEALKNPIIAAMMRDESPISSDELPPTLLSESPALVSEVLSFLDPEQLHSLHHHAEEILRTAEHNGLPIREATLEIRALLEKEATSSAESPD